MIGVFCLAAEAQSLLYGTNSMSVSILSITPLQMDVSDTFTISYRYDRFSISSRTSLGVAGLTGQSFRLSTPIGDYSVQGSASFTSEAFTNANFAISTSWEGVGLTTTLVAANQGSVQTPSYGAGITLRASGMVEGLGRFTVITGIGATPYGSILEDCDLTFGGARISWSSVPFCGGTGSFDIVFSCDGLDAQYWSWTMPLPFCDLRLRVNGVHEGLFLFQGLSVSTSGTLWGARTNGTIAYDETLTFTQGSWSVTNDFFGGRLSSTLSYDEASIISQSFTWSRAWDFWSLTLSPEFEILAFDWQTMEFDIPSLRATLRWDLACCLGLHDDIDLGDLVLNLTVSRDGFDRIAATYTMVF